MANGPIDSPGMPKAFTDTRMIGHAMRRREGVPGSHLAMALQQAEAYGRGRPVQGKLFNDSPSTSYGISPDFSSRKITNWGRPHYPEA